MFLKKKGNYRGLTVYGKLDWEAAEECEKTTRLMKAKQLKRLLNSEKKIMQENKHNNIPQYLHSNNNENTE